MMSFWIVPVRLVRGAPCLVGDGDVEREQPGGGRVDRHRRVHAVERDAVEQRAHVADVGDGDADLADFAAGEDVVAVVAGLGRQIEGDREPGLALGEVALVELVRLGRRRMAGIGAENPGLLGRFRGLVHVRSTRSTINPSTHKVAESYCNATETFASFRGCELRACAGGSLHNGERPCIGPGEPQYGGFKPRGAGEPAEIALIPGEHP